MASSYQAHGTFFWAATLKLLDFHSQAILLKLLFIITLVAIIETHVPKLSFEKVLGFQIILNRVNQSLDSFSVKIQTIKPMLLNKLLNNIEMSDDLWVLTFISIPLDVSFQVFIEVKAHQTVEHGLLQFLLAFFHFNQHVLFSSKLLMHFS